ncbi:MAG: TIGR00730 family Rossman fold protein, partial [Planctomycetaceae bacterium]|nr:TIGR00730 family Rossman fold protein [Planctomycetaceae bacterium]
TRGDLKIIARSLKELRYSFKFFKPFRRQRKITVFGSARMPPEHPAYQLAVEFGRRMASAGWFVVTGAGGGIMEAAHVGAGRDWAIGLNIMLPFEQSANSVMTGNKNLINLRYFFTRKLLFVKEVHAIALFAGGFGTQDECFETLTLVQTGKRDLMPIVCIDTPGSTYWRDWLEYIRKHLLDTSLISPADLSLIKVTDDLDEAYDEIMGFYSVYNSMRYVHDKLYLRLHKRPTPEFIVELNRDFADIIERGRIELTSAHPFEGDDDHLRELPRLAFRFNRRDIGRLRQMVDRINDVMDDPDHAGPPPAQAAPSQG